MYSHQFVIEMRRHLMQRDLQCESSGEECDGAVYSLLVQIRMSDFHLLLQRDLPI